MQIKRIRQNDHPRQTVFMYDQILPTSAIRNIWRKVRRTGMLILGLKQLIGNKASGQTQLLWFTYYKGNPREPPTGQTKMVLLTGKGQFMSTHTHTLENLPVLQAVIRAVIELWRHWLHIKKSTCSVAGHKLNKVSHAWCLLVIFKLRGGLHHLILVVSHNGRVLAANDCPVLFLI